VPAPSYDDLAGNARSAAQTARPDLFFDEGDVSDMVVHAAAAGADYLTGYATQLVKGLFLDTSFGQALTTLADDRYGILRTPAAKAVGSVTLARASFAAGAGSVPAGTLIATAFDSQGGTVEIETTAIANFGGATLSVDVAVRAKLEGSSGNIAATKANRLVSSVFDPTITVSNAARMAGGAEEEGDESLRERVRTFPTTIRRATIAALEYGAKTVPGVVSAKVFESDTGLVTVYVADATGYSNAELNAAVQLELVNWRAAGVVVQVVSAVPLEQDITVAIKAKPTFSVASSIGLIQEAIEARMAKLTMSETLFLDELRAAIGALIGDAFQRATFSAPLTDVVPLPQEKIIPGAITVTVEA
jgi:uncharacterized phage protein gp47/JayE